MMNIYLALLLFLLLFSPLAPLITSLLNIYEHTIDTIKDLPPHIYFPVPGKDLDIEASFNGTHLAIKFLAKNTCRIYVYSTPSARLSRMPGTSGTAVLMQGFFVIAVKNNSTRQCSEANETLVLPLPKDIVKNSSKLLVIVNDRIVHVFTVRKEASQNTKPEAVTVIGGAYPFFDHDVRVRIKWATIYDDKLHLCIAVTHDGGGDYINLVNKPPNFYKIYDSKPSPIYIHQVDRITVVEIHLLAVSDLLVLQSAVCDPIPLTIELKNAPSLVYVKIYVNGELAVTKAVATNAPPASCQQCLP